MKHPRLVRTGAVVGVCALAGAGAGIAGSAAAPSTTKAPTTRNGTFRPGGPGPRGMRGMREAVHSVSVVPNQAGTGFDTVTTDSGAFQSVSGQDLTITEGTKTATYKTVTLTIPSNATIRRNDATATLADLRSGDHVRVTQSAQGVTVDAVDAAHLAQHGPGDHPGGPGGPGGPPPAGGY